MRSSTYLRRSVARARLLSGLLLDGNFGSDASMAAFAERELIERLAVIELGGGGDAVGTVAEENLVEIQLEDFVLRSIRVSMRNERKISVNLRVRLTSELRKNPRATCCVIVLPPGTCIVRLVIIRPTARATPCQSTPGWL